MVEHMPGRSPRRVPNRPSELAPRAFVGNPSVGTESERFEESIVRTGKLCEGILGDGLVRRPKLAQVGLLGFAYVLDHLREVASAAARPPAERHTLGGLHPLIK